MHRTTLRAAFALAVVLSLVPGVAGAQSSPSQRGIDRVCPPPAPAETVSFSDIARDPHRESIECVATYGIVRGHDDGTYRSAASVSRGQMATFILNLIDAAHDAMPFADDLESEGGDREEGTQWEDGEPSFTDTDGHTHGDSIELLAAYGVVNGFDDGSFRPNLEVNRAQMATFLVRALDYIDDFDVNRTHPDRASRSWFTDLGNSPHRPAIDALAELGIAVGDGQGRYHPERGVTRGQLATFVARSADHLHEVGMWWWSPVRITFDPEFATLLVGEQVASTLELTDRDGVPLAGEYVEVLGERWNSEEMLELGRHRTDADGEIALTYAGPDATDVDILFACYDRCAMFDDEDWTPPQGAAYASFARQADAGDTAAEEFVLDVTATTFDSFTVSDQGEISVTRWAYDGDDTYRDEREFAPSQGTITAAQFRQRIEEFGSCVAVDTYAPGGQNSFVLVECRFGGAEARAAFVRPLGALGTTTRAEPPRTRTGRPSTWRPSRAS